MFLQVCVCPQGGGAWCGGVCSGGCLVPGGSAPRRMPGPGGLVSHHALRQTPPGEMATAADGMHPTGMHSCFTHASKGPDIIMHQLRSIYNSSFKDSHSHLFSNNC